MTTEAATDYTFAFASLPTGQRTHVSWFGTSHLLTPDHFDFTGDTHRIFHLGLPGIHRLMDAPWKDDANGWVTTLKKARATRPPDQYGARQHSARAPRRARAAMPSPP